MCEQENQDESELLRFGKIFLGVADAISKSETGLSEDALRESLSLMPDVENDSETSEILTALDKIASPDGPILKNEFGQIFLPKQKEFVEQMKSLQDESEQLDVEIDLLQKGDQGLSAKGAKPEKKSAASAQDVGEFSSTVSGKIIITEIQIGKEKKVGSESQNDKEKKVGNEIQNDKEKKVSSEIQSGEEKKDGTEIQSDEDKDEVDSSQETCVSNVDYSSTGN